MSDVYYNGNLGDICNVDWFFLHDNRQLKDVNAVEISTKPGVGLWVSIHFQKTLHIEGAIVKSPKLPTNGAPRMSAATPKFTTADIGMVVWLDMQEGAKREAGELVGIVSASGMLDVGIISCGVRVVYTFCQTAVHRDETGTPLSGKSASADDRPQRTEAERMRDFFRGKDTW